MTSQTFPTIGGAPAERQTAKDPQFAYTLARGLAVLRSFDATSPMLSTREISERTGIARPTAARLVRTLVMQGYLKPAGSTPRYRLAASVLSFAYPLLAQLSVRQIARQDMQQLANFAKGAVSLTMRSGLDMVIVESCMDNSALTGRPDLGATRPIATTALGAAYYSAAGPEEQAGIRKDLRAADPSGWPALEKGLEECERQYGARGYCTSVAAPMGIQAVATPLRSNIDGEILVMNCAVASFNLQADTLEEQIAPRLLNLVRSVEIALGTGATQAAAPSAAARASREASQSPSLNIAKRTSRVREANPPAP